MSRLFRQFGKSVFIEWHFSNFNENFKKKSRFQLQHLVPDEFPCPPNGLQTASKKPFYRNCSSINQKTLQMHCFKIYFRKTYMVPHSEMVIYSRRKKVENRQCFNYNMLLYLRKLNDFFDIWDV